MLKTGKILLVVMVLVVLMAAGCSSSPEAGGAAPEVGGTAPDFQLKGLDGQNVSLSDFRGRPVLLNFWATWCGPCRQEIPFIQEVFEDPAWVEKGLVVLAVNLGESADVVRGFMDGNGLFFTVLLDSTKEVGMQYNTRYIPTTYFIDKNGIIQNVKVGAFARKSDIDQYINSLVAND